MEGLNVSNVDLIFLLNSIAKICATLETTDSTAHAMSKMEHEFVTEKFKPFITTASSESVRRNKRCGSGMLMACIWSGLMIQSCYVISSATTTPMLESYKL
jgi:hypothetical protein